MSPSRSAPLSSCSMKFFAKTLRSDVSDIQQGTTSEGVHLGAMAGRVDLVERVLTGIEVEGDVLRLNPDLPQETERLDMRIRYRGRHYPLVPADETTKCVAGLNGAQLKIGLRTHSMQKPTSETSS